ncbi:SET and MYND domain-containing protein 4-like [Phymastichus coffea]|uniref:SET and MYND domain-containing protein 4-like n=1 Tax=Phymastichus coffea TaxID=108790 RepID=UPI00273B14BD|nr:SET and MYND domain-containing protein 4-like [Phymastichus coffea]
MLPLDDKSGLLGELKAAAQNRWSRWEAVRKGRLLEATRAGNRLAIVEAVSGLLPEYELEAYYDGKNEAAATELLERGQLTEALARAPPTSGLFGRVLGRRMRHYYRAGELARCARDCRYAEQRVQERDEECAALRVEALVLRAHCSRAAGEAPEVARGLLNEAMRRINEIAASANDSRSAKARLLRSCLLDSEPAPAGDAARGAAARPSTVPPDLHAGPHRFLSCCSATLALSREPARGRLLRAARDIEPGSVLIVDRPYSFSTDLPALRTNCANCHLSFRLVNVTQIPCSACTTVRYCSEQCAQQAWDRFHKYECRIFKYFYHNDLQKCNALLAYRTVATACLGEDFIRLHENDKDSIDVTLLMDKYEPDNYETVFGLETHCTDRQLKSYLDTAVCSIFLASCLIYSLRQLGLKVDFSEKFENILAVSFLRNIQAIECNAYEIVENVRNEETKVFEPRNVGGAIYTSVSLTNHSCYPNVVRHCFPNGVVAVTSLRSIPKGSEILDCYGQHFLENDRDHRRRHLKMKYYFECQCEACSFDWPSKLQNNDFSFKCKRCLKQCRKSHNTLECTECGQKSGISKLYNLLQSSIEKKRVTALTKMYDGYYNEALPLLIEHAKFIGKILVEPSLEAIKTQQSIIQCLNAMSCTSV